jgi:hypothetical protein
LLVDLLQQGGHRRIGLPHLLLEQRDLAEQGPDL